MTVACRLLRKALFVVALSSGTAMHAASAPAQTGATGLRSAEMPELSGVGAFEVGTQYRDLASGRRTIGVRIWYPASAGRGPRAVYQHSLSLPGQQPVSIKEFGSARPGAAPLPRKFPLVLISHGYQGWAEHMSRLGEVLASRGYVVASLDHLDPVFKDGPGFLASFGSVLVNRSADQALVLRELIETPLFGAAIRGEIDTSAIGLIGYSMGGYGALITAGAPINRDASPFAQMPTAWRQALPMPDPALKSRIKALVAIAPWGAQPDTAVWQATDLAKITAPLLMIDGDRDDVVDFRRGVTRAFSDIRGSDRYLLVYREAAHNVAGNPVSLPPDANFSAIEAAADPVWRKERIEAINEHFILAFLHKTLKRDAKMDAYLNVPTANSDDGEWPTQFGQQWGGTFAGNDQPRYWRGFQRRWARGLEMHHKAAGE